ncbi:hypothetical protein HDV02_001633 [Globomyces sp. JEL0801]|nr:hypothetical protein HDV02_001633 [Globomyces sp. JEL0801]
MWRITTKLGIQTSWESMYGQSHEAVLEDSSMSINESDKLRLIDIQAELDPHMHAMIQRVWKNGIQDKK